MIQRRAAKDRGRTRLDWLDSWHSFSFGDYYDPGHMGFRALRVINDDIVEPGRGFGTHPHSDMEIITWVLDGALEHKDSMGTGSTISPGEGQRMSAGTGVLHSEFNPSTTDRVRFLQIWILPDKRGNEPEYEQRTFDPAELKGNLRLIAGPSGGPGALDLHQDVRVLAGRFDEGGRATHPIADGRHAWVQVARGAVDLNGVALGEGDGAAVSDERALEIFARRPSEVLVFDLA